MGRIVSQFFVSLDGVVEAPQRFHLPYFDEAMGSVMAEVMGRARAVLMGRRLYDEWSAYWPENTSDEFAGFINSVPKYVLSDSLTDPAWEGTTVLGGPGAADEMRALKERTDGDVTMSGCATTVRWLLSRGLLDELDLLVDPVVVGSGQRLFEGDELQRLRLLTSDALPTGVLRLRYAPAQFGE